MNEMKQILIAISFCTLFSCSNYQKDSGFETTDSVVIKEPTISDTMEIEPKTSTEERTTTPDIIWNESVRVYLNDPDLSPTNVRKSPGGEILFQLSERYGWEIRIIGVNSGWFIVNNIENIDIEDEIYQNINGYLHGSVLAASTRNYGGEEIRLYSAPDEKSDVVLTIIQETQVRLKDGNEDGSWLYVSFLKDGITEKGWIQSKWLCGSVRTNCS